MNEETRLKRRAELAASVSIAIKAALEASELDAADKCQALIEGAMVSVIARAESLGCSPFDAIWVIRKCASNLEKIFAEAMHEQLEAAFGAPGKEGYLDKMLTELKNSTFPTRE